MAIFIDNKFFPQNFYENKKFLGKETAQIFAKISTLSHNFHFCESEIKCVFVQPLIGTLSVDCYEDVISLYVDITRIRRIWTETSPPGRTGPPTRLNILPELGKSSFKSLLSWRHFAVILWLWVHSRLIGLCLVIGKP